MSHSLPKQSDGVSKDLNMAQAMLGLKRWIPRALVGSNTSSSTHSNSLGIRCSVETAKDKVAAYGAMNIEPAVRSIRSLQLSEGIEVTGHGVWLHSQKSTYVWFMPLPWRGQNRWFAFREQQESILLQQALSEFGLYEPLNLLLRYLEYNWEIADLPTIETFADHVALPSTTRTIITLSGVTSQYLIGQSFANNDTEQNWHGQKVRVICLPHPCCCLYKPALKRDLWSALMKLKYEN